MSIRLIPVRLKSDHTVTAEIAESTLQHYPAFEPIPAEPKAGTADPGTSLAEGGVVQHAEPVPEATAPADTRKAARRPAASDKEQ